MSVMTSIQITNELRKRLKKLAAEDDTSYDKLIIKLVNFYEERNKNGISINSTA